MIVAGADWSTSSAAITIFDTDKEFKFENVKMFNICSTKKFCDHWGDNIEISFMPKAKDFKCDEARYDMIASWGIEILRKYNVSKVCIEGYSYGSAQGQAWNIGENTGLFKHQMYKNDIEFIKPAPTDVKKIFTGKGNAKKDKMCIVFEQMTGINIPTLIGAKHERWFKSPVNDLVDSYAMLYYLLQKEEF